MRVVVAKNVRSEFGPAIDRLFSEKRIEDARLDPTTPLFRKPDWRELGFPHNPWKGVMHIGDTSDPSEYGRQFERAWIAWMETVAEIGTTEIAMVGMPLDARASEEPAAAIAPLERDGILEAGHAVMIFISNEWVAFDGSESWAVRCHWEGISILGASPEWMRRFRARYGKLAPLKTMFEDIVDSEFGAGDYAETGDAIKAGVRWPED